MRMSAICAELTLCRSCSHSSNCYEFMYAIALSYLTNTISLQSSTTPISIFFAPPSMMIPEQGGRWCHVDAHLQKGTP